MCSLFSSTSPLCLLTHERSAEIQEDEVRVSPPPELHDLFRLARLDQHDRGHGNGPEEAVEVQEAGAAVGVTAGDIEERER